MLPNLKPGGAERVSVLLAAEFGRRGYNVDFALLRAEGELLTDVPQGVRVIDLKSTRIREGLLPTVRYLRREQPRAVLANMWPLSGVAILAKKIARSDSRVVACEHTNMSRDPYSRKALSGLILRYFGRRVYSWADSTVAVSEGVKESLSSGHGLDATQINVIYNPVRPINPNVVSDADILQVLLAGGPSIVAAGSLKEAKDFPNLIRGFARLRQERTARLLVLGEGPLRGELEALVASLDLQDSVFMPGHVPDPYPYLAHADLFVLSSAYEGLPGVLLEALVAGVPVVSTDCPSGPAEILENGKYGSLVRVGDPAALAAAMGEALDAPVDREMLRRRGTEFSIERAAEQYLALLDPPSEVVGR
jgi:glycosyltransferase involved in cell wall biosynthesis